MGWLDGGHDELAVKWILSRPGDTNSFTSGCSDPFATRTERSEDSCWSSSRGTLLQYPKESMRDLEFESGVVQDGGTGRIWRREMVQGGGASK